MSDAGQPGWPNGVRPTLVPDLKRLGINDQNESFWDGRHVEIRRSLTLTRFQKVHHYHRDVLCSPWCARRLCHGIQQRIRILVCPT
jgi:hypothetical protein